MSWQDLAAASAVVTATLCSLLLWPGASRPPPMEVYTIFIQPAPEAPPTPLDPQPVLPAEAAATVAAPASVPAALAEVAAPDHAALVSNYWSDVYGEIARHLRYPAAARMQGKEGRIPVTFRLDH